MRQTGSKLSFILSLSGLILASAPASATREMVVPARVGYEWTGCGGGGSCGKFSDAHCFFDYYYYGEVRLTSACQTSPGVGTWEMPIPSENRTGGGTQTLWLRILTGTNVTAEVDFASYYSDGTVYSKISHSGQTTGKISESITVPEDGWAMIWFITSSYWAAALNYGYQYEF